VAKRQANGNYVHDGVTIVRESPRRWKVGPRVCKRLKDAVEYVDTFRKVVERAQAVCLSCGDEGIHPCRGIQVPCLGCERGRMAHYRSLTNQMRLAPSQEPAENRLLQWRRAGR